MNIDRSKSLILLTIVALAAITGGIMITTYATENGEENSNGFPEWFNERMRLGTKGFSCQEQRRLRRYRFVEVSEEFKENVISIAESDLDVQDLLNEGYNITRVKPIIKSIVEADGDVVTKATNAVIVLNNDTTNHAFVVVDVDEGTVTKIVILTRTVIDK